MHVRQRVEARAFSSDRFQAYRREPQSVTLSSFERSPRGCLAITLYRDQPIVRLTPLVIRGAVPDEGAFDLANGPGLKRLEAFRRFEAPCLRDRDRTLIPMKNPERLDRRVQHVS